MSTSNSPKETGQKMLRDFRASLGVVDDCPVYDHQTEKTRLTHFQANVAEISTRLKRRELLHSDEVLRSWSNLIAAARAKMLSLPSRLASATAQMPFEVVKAEVLRIVNEALCELDRGGVDGLGGAAGRTREAQGPQPGLQVTNEPPASG